MKILAVEFSSEQRSVAIVDGDAASTHLRGSAQETGGRSAHAFALIEGALRQAKLEREEIDCIAVGLGPGSYTGIRAAIALAQGWQLALGIKLVGISSVECLAAQAHQKSYRGTAHFIVDAQRSEFYLSTWEITETDFEEKRALQIVPFAEVENRVRSGEQVFGPEATRYFKNATDLFAEAATLGRIALAKNEFISGEKLEPIYLRETNFVKAPPARIL